MWCLKGSRVGWGKEESVLASGTPLPVSPAHLRPDTPSDAEHRVGGPDEVYAALNTAASHRNNMYYTHHRTPVLSAP